MGLESTERLGKARDVSEGVAVGGRGVGAATAHKQGSILATAEVAPMLCFDPVEDQSFLYG